MTRDNYKSDDNVFLVGYYMQEQAIIMRSYGYNDNLMVSSLGYLQMPVPSAHALKPLDSSLDHGKTSLRVDDSIEKSEQCLLLLWYKPCLC
jgi:hypothetical protein